jgi:hypothetical protein
MNPSVEAALIGGCFGLIGIAGTVAVALAGFRANRGIATDAAQHERTRAMWEKKCAAYEDILAVMDERQAYRSRLLNAARQATGSQTAELPGHDSQAERYLAAFHDPDTIRTRSRLVAYASPEVKTMYWQVIVDDIALDMRLRMWPISVKADQIKLKAQETRARAESRRKPDEHLDYSALDAQVRKVSRFPTASEAWSQVEQQQAVVLSRDLELTSQIRRELGSEPDEQPAAVTGHRYLPALSRPLTRWLGKTETRSSRAARTQP